MRNPKRTARTAAALMVGVALVAGISVLAASIKDSVRSIFEQAVHRRLRGEHASFGFGGLSPSTGRAAQRAARGGGRRRHADRLRTGRRQRQRAQRRRSGAGGSAVRLRVRGRRAHGPDGRVHPGEREPGRRRRPDARRHADGPAPRRLHAGPAGAGHLQRDDLAGPYTVSKGLYAQTGADQFDFSVFILKADGVSEEQAEAAITQVASAYPNAKVQSRDDYITSQAAQIDSSSTSSTPCWRCR